MKKLVRILIVLILCFTTFSVKALRSSRFEATFETDEQFSNEQVSLYFGWRGENAYKVEMDVEIDATMLEFLQVVPGDTFEVSYKEENIGSGKKKYHFEFTSDTVYDNIIYSAVVMKLSDKFKVNKSSEIKVYNVYAYNDDGLKYRSNGYYIELERKGKNDMLAIRTDINSDTNRDRFIKKALPFVIIGIVAVFLIIFAILLIPSRFNEDRREKINAQLDPANYPIPGVGPFPKMKKKEKSDVIEPEEKVIQPLKEFLSKSDEVNEELMNKDLEVDKDMFKDNPTKEGEGGLININPLAFDDGEDEVLDDGRDDNDDIDTL